MEYNVIKTIRDRDFSIKEKKLCNPTLRYASRGILFDFDGNIAIINKKVKNEYKLPGGGIENETKEAAFLREIYEETGCDAKIIDCIGITIEEKSKTNFKQISYIFIGKVTNKTNELHLTEKEKMEQTNVIWTSIEKGLELIENSEKTLIGSKYDSRYQSLFMVRRDAEIIKYYKEYIKKKYKKTE